MATHKGLVVKKPAEPLEIVDDLPRPSPGPRQAVVKSLYVAINPV
jgi:D-arabinose 1-dehydrogenase-like Zn-dependent alcohol dehydrogenase